MSDQTTIRVGKRPTALGALGTFFDGETASADVRRDLFESMKEVAETGKGPADQIPSMGCSIKWKDEG